MNDLIDHFELWIDGAHFRTYATIRGARKALKYWERSNACKDQTGSRLYEIKRESEVEIAKLANRKKAEHHRYLESLDLEGHYEH